MIQRIGKRNFSIYAFDIESHNDYKSLKLRQTSMWLGCLLNENSDPRKRNSYVFSMNEFIDKIIHIFISDLLCNLIDFQVCFN